MSEQHAPYAAAGFCPVRPYVQPHCWHTLGVNEFRWAGQDWHQKRVVEQCCWCGEQRWRDLEDVGPGNHGPHAPGAQSTRGTGEG